MGNGTQRRVLAALLLTVVSGCGGTTEQTANDGGSSGGPCGAVKTAGKAVVSACDTSVTLHDAGDGFGPIPPAGSNCQGATYTLMLATQQFSWSVCDTTVTPWLGRSGMRSLLMTEYQTLLGNLENVTVSTQAQCGADKSTITMTVAFPGGTQDYEDHFYACQGGNVVYVANIDNPLATMSTLAGQ